MSRKRPVAARKRRASTRTDSIVAAPRTAPREMAIVRRDSYANALTGLGTTRDKRLGGFVAYTRIEYQEAEDLWRGDDMAAKIIEEPAREMTRRWFDVQIEPGEKQDPTESKETSEAVEKDLMRLSAKKRVREAIMRQRAFGGSAIVLGANDGQDDLTEPLNEKKLASIDFLNVFDAYEVYPQSYYADPDDEKFGLPKTYYVNPASMPGSPSMLQQNVVHETRLLRFEGVAISRRAVAANRGWPDSALTRVKQVLADFGMGWDGAAHLLQDFAQAVFRMRGLAEASAAGAEGEELIRKRHEDVELGRSLLRAIVLDAGQGNGEPMEEFERKATPIAGLAELLDRFSNRLAAAADMPVTRLMGQSPAGLNATGRQDENWWFDRIGGLQEEVVLEPVTRLVRLLFLCKEGPTKGVVPENWSIVFRPLQQESAMERADRMGRLASAHATWIGAKVLMPEEIAISTFGGDEFSDHIHIDKDRRKKTSDLRPVVEVSPPDVQALIALWQSQGIAFSEMRERLRNAGIAILDDEKAKDEMEANPPVPPGMGGPGGPGAPPGPEGPPGIDGETLVTPEDLAAAEEGLSLPEDGAPEEEAEEESKPEKQAKADALPPPPVPLVVPVVVDRHADEAALVAAVAEGLAPVLEKLDRPRTVVLDRDEEGKVIGATGRREDGDFTGHPFRGNQFTEGQGAGASGPGAPEPQVESQAFRSWFGDSKAVDAQGKPLRLYHGTGKSFSEFRGGWIYVSADPKFASKFATSPVAIPSDPGASYEAKITERDGTERTVRGWKSDLPGVFVAEVGNGSYSLTHETSGAALTTGFETPTEALATATKLGKKLGNVFTSFRTFEEGKALPEETRAKIATALKSARPKQSDFDDIAESFSYSGSRGRGAGVGVGSQVMPLYASVKKPLDLRELPARNVHPRRVVEALNKAGIDVTMRDFPFANRDLYQMLNDESVQEAVRSKAVAAGYDGIVYKDFFDAKHRGESWVVFHPEQLKSALGNRGTFDPKRRSVVDAADREDGDSPGHPFRGNQHAEAPVDAGGGSGGGAPAASARTPTGAQGAARWATKSTDPATMTPGEINRELDRLERVASEVNDALIAAGRGWEKFSETAQKAKDNPNDTLAQDLVRVNDRQGKLRGEIAARYGPDAPSRLPPGFKARKRDEERADYDPDQPRDEQGRWAEGGGSLSVRGPDEPAGGGSGKPPPSVDELTERLARSASRVERSRYMLSITSGAKRPLVERDLRWAENELREAQEALASAQAARPAERGQSDEPASEAAKPPAVRRNARAQACDTCGGLVPPQQGRLHRCMGLSSGCFEHEEEEEGGWHVSCLDKGGCEGRIEKRKAAQKAFTEAANARSRAIKEILPLFDEGEKPDLKSWPEGEKFPVGGRNEIRIGKDAIWSIVYNGADGDNWSANNAPGAIVTRLPRTPDLEAKIRAIPLVKRDGEVADAYDPDQPRDEKGRWSEGGGASVSGPEEPEGGGPVVAGQRVSEGAQNPEPKQRVQRHRRRRRSPEEALKDRIERERYAIERQFRERGERLPWETVESLFARPVDRDVVIIDPGVHRSGREWVVFRPTEMLRIHGGYYDDYLVTGQRLPRTPQTAALERRVRALAERLRGDAGGAEWEPGDHPRGQPGNAGQFVEKGAAEAPAEKPAEEKRAALSSEHEAALAHARLVDVHALYERATKAGGVTYSVAKVAFPTRGFVVSTRQDAEQPVKGDITERLIKDYLERYALDLKAEDACLGAWHDLEKGKWYLDVVEVRDSRDEAIALARAHNQEAIYDLERGETVIVKAAHERRDAAQAPRVFVRLDPRKLTITEMVAAMRAIEKAAQENEEASEQDHEDALPAEWDQEKHPRGQPGNKGQFASAPGGGGAGADEEKRPAQAAAGRATGEEIAAAVRSLSKDPRYSGAPLATRAQLVAQFIREKRVAEATAGKSEKKVEPKAKAESKEAKESAKENDTARIEAERERWAKRARADLGKAGKQWARLSLAERDALGDARNTIPARVSELVGKRNWPDAKDENAAISARLEQFRDEIPAESRSMVRDLGHGILASLRECGVKDEHAATITRQAVDHVIAQDMEAQRRTLGDHGAHHLYGNDRIARDILAAIPGNHDTPQNRLMMGLAAAYHDAGYLAPPAQNFLDKDHPRWGSQFFAEHVQPRVAEALGKDFAQSTAQVIYGHDTNRLDWEREPNLAAFSTADNLALFHKEKMPPVLRYVKENTKTLVAFAEGKLKLDEAKAKMRENIKASDLPKGVKARFSEAVDEVNGVLPKFTIGMIGTKLEGVEWEDDHLRVNVARTKANEALAKVLDLGQAQFEKLAKTYNASGKELIAKGKLDLKESGKTRLSVVMRGHRGDTWFELLLDEEPDLSIEPTSGRD